MQLESEKKIYSRLQIQSCIFCSYYSWRKAKQTNLNTILAVHIRGKGRKLPSAWRLDVWWVAPERVDMCLSAKIPNHVSVANELNMKCDVCLKKRGVPKDKFAKSKVPPTLKCPARQTKSCWLYIRDLVLKIVQLGYFLRFNPGEMGSIESFLNPSN